MLLHLSHTLPSSAIIVNITRIVSSVSSGKSERLKWLNHGAIFRLPEVDGHEYSFSV